MSTSNQLYEGFNEKEVETAKKLYWQSSNMSEVFLHWMESHFDRFVCYREQIRVLSVYSGDPDLDVKLIQKFQEVFVRFRYVIVEPVSDWNHRDAISKLSISNYQSVEVSPYPSFITLDTLETFDLIFLFGIPTNIELCEYVINKTQLLLREGGSAIALYPNDSIFTNFCQILHSEMVSHEMEPNSFIPVNNDDIKNCLKTNNILYKCNSVDSQLNIESIVKRSNESDLLLSVLLHTDLRDITNELYTTILNKMLSLKIDATSFCIDYSFALYYIIGNGVTADCIRAGPRDIKTEWYPEGEKGEFVNVGEDRWMKQINKWREKDLATMPPPMKPLDEEYEDDILDLISEMENPIFELPCMVPLNDLLRLYREEWNRNFGTR